MAGYIDIYDITAKLPLVTIDSTSEPSTTRVEDMIAEVEASMDARFAAAGIIIPVTGASKILVVSAIAANGVLAEVLRALNREPEAAAERQRLYDAAMANIERHPDILRETEETYSTPGGSEREYIPFHRNARDW